MGTIFYIYRYVGLSMGNRTKSTYVKKNPWAKLRGPNTRMLKVCFGLLKPNLKQTRASEIEEQRKGWIRPENKKTENHERQRLATLKRLKRSDDNEF